MDFSGVLDVPEGHARRVAFLVWLDRMFREAGAAPPFVVGGMAVEMLTGGVYATGDLDVKCDRDVLEQVLRQAGFTKAGRVWVHHEAGLYVDWLGNGPEAPHERAADALTLRLGDGMIRLISPEDLVLDRIRAAAHWNDRDSEIWASEIAAVVAAAGLPFRWEAVTERLEDEREMEIAERLRRGSESNDAPGAEIFDDPCP